MKKTPKTGYQSKKNSWISVASIGSVCGSGLPNTNRHPSKRLVAKGRSSSGLAGIRPCS